MLDVSTMLINQIVHCIVSNCFESLVMIQLGIDSMMLDMERIKMLAHMLSDACQ